MDSKLDKNEVVMKAFDTIRNKYVSMRWLYVDRHFKVHEESRDGLGWCPNIEIHLFLYGERIK